MLITIIAAVSLAINLALLMVMKKGLNEVILGLATIKEELSSAEVVSTEPSNRA